MAKVIIRDLKSGRISEAAKRAVSTKRVVSAGGTRVVRSLDANSPLFGESLRYVFSKNVAKARRENKRISGSADIAPKKR